MNPYLYKPDEQFELGVRGMVRHAKQLSGAGTELLQVDPAFYARTVQHLVLDAMATATSLEPPSSQRGGAIQADLLARREDESKRGLEANFGRPLSNLLRLLWQFEQDHPTRREIGGAVKLERTFFRAYHEFCSEASRLLASQVGSTGTKGR